MRVKSSKAQNKQMFSGLRRKADTRGLCEYTPWFDTEVGMKSASGFAIFRYVHV